MADYGYANYGCGAGGPPIETGCGGVVYNPYLPEASGIATGLSNAEVNASSSSAGFTGLLSNQQFGHNFNWGWQYPWWGYGYYPWWGGYPYYPPYNPYYPPYYPPYYGGYYVAPWWSSARLGSSIVLAGSKDAG